jgi:hypothetical protein
MWTTSSKPLFAISMFCSALFISAQVTVASNAEILQPSKTQLKSNISGSLLLSQRKDWDVTKEGTDRTCLHKTFGTFSRHKTTKLWWSKDNAGHGTPPSAWKVFDETSKSLEWKADADRYGDFIVGKHKGPTGTSIPFSELSCRS